MDPRHASSFPEGFFVRGDETDDADFYAFDRFVLVGTGGLAFASADYARAGERDRKVMFGWSLGGGLDVALTERLSARAEYLYVDLDRRGFDAGGLAPIGASGGLARLGVNYRF